MKTLIVEDDRVSACLLRRLLEQQGHEVTLVETGVEAWQKLRSETFRLILARWLMPELDGIELCRRIRGRKDADYTYIILLSTKDRREDRVSALQAGADDFLTKPPDREELLARLSVVQRVLNMETELSRKTIELERMNVELERMNDLNQKYIAEIGATCRDLEQANALLKEKSITDSLTGLKNHREFQERLEEEISRAYRYNLPLSLIMLDVDYFKRYNDSYGHPAGDEVLKRLAHILQVHSRETDTLARYGGEEFAIILANTDCEHAMAAAERFRCAIENNDWPHERITVSMGVSTLDILPQTRTDLTTEADMALYACKSRGRNCIAHYVDMRTPA